MDKNRTVGFELRTASNLIKRRVLHFAKMHSNESITGTHGWAIGYFYERRNRDIFQRDFEEEFFIRRSTATKILQLMERNGLITRQAVDYDARMKKIQLTQKALDAHEMIIRQLEAIEKELRKD